MSVGIVGGSVSPSTALVIDPKTSTTYTFVITDANNELITASNASAQTYSIPTNASVAFPIGSQINIIQIGTGQVTINAVTENAAAKVLANDLTCFSNVATSFLPFFNPLLSKVLTADTIKFGIRQPSLFLFFC